MTSSSFPASGVDPDPGTGASFAMATTFVAHLSLSFFFFEAFFFPWTPYLESSVSSFGYFSPASSSILPLVFLSFFFCRDQHTTAREKSKYKKKRKEKEGPAAAKNLLNYDRKTRYDSAPHREAAELQQNKTRRGKENETFDDPSRLLNGSLTEFVRVSRWDAPLFITPK